MAADLEIEAFAARADDARTRTLAERWKRVAKRNAIMAYRRLFLDAEGNMKPDAVAVIADIAALAQLGRVLPPYATEGELRAFEGRRSMALHILGRMDLDGSRLRDLAKKMREEDHG